MAISELAKLETAASHGIRSFSPSSAKDVYNAMLKEVNNYETSEGDEASKTLEECFHTDLKKAQKSSSVKRHLSRLVNETQTYLTKNVDTDDDIDISDNYWDGTIYIMNWGIGNRQISAYIDFSDDKNLDVDFEE
jgi:hypothetical protein